MRSPRGGDAPRPQPSANRELSVHRSFRNEFKAVPRIWQPLEGARRKKAGRLFSGFVNQPIDAVLAQGTGRQITLGMFESGVMLIQEERGAGPGGRP